MTHVRTTIRQTVCQLLGTKLPNTGYNVLGTRTSKRNRSAIDQDAVVDVRITDVAVTAQGMNDLRLHTATLVIQVTREGKEETLDDMLDQDEVLVTQAMSQIDWTRLLETDPELTQITFARDGESDVAIGAIMLRYTVEYRISKNNPETVRN
jgi:hypothetical protein